MQFDDGVIKILNINKEHYYKIKGVEDNNLWLTIISVYLVNEIYYLFKLKNEEQFEKTSSSVVIKKLEKDFEEMELLNSKWERSRNYIFQSGISTLELATEIGTFVNGMIQNFNL